MRRLPCSLCLPAAAAAQSAFAGTVRDTSGAVMPGVTVEAASPALIEKVRSAVTDENGVYRIIDLRPGVYSLTYTLPGFNTITRDGVELGSNFTATINIELTVGTLQESITVSGASPVVDVSSNVKQQVLSRDVLDAVPTAQDHPGPRATRRRRDAQLAGRRRLARDAADLLRDPRTGRRADGGARRRADDQRPDGRRRRAGLPQRGDDAGSRVPDRRRIGRDADRRRQHEPGAQGRRQPASRGGFKIAKSPASWQGDNLTDRPDRDGRDRRRSDRQLLRVQRRAGRPIIRNKLWFYGAFRKAQYDKPIANTFVPPARTCRVPQAFAQCIASRAAASRASRTRRWTTRSSG